MISLREMCQLILTISQYAREHHLELEGYAYEMGMNDLVIQDEGEFLTRILIKLKELI